MFWIYESLQAASGPSRKALMDVQTFEGESFAFVLVETPRWGFEALDEACLHLSSLPNSSPSKLETFVFIFQAFET